MVNLKSRCLSPRSFNNSSSIVPPRTVLHRWTPLKAFVSRSVFDTHAILLSMADSSSSQPLLHDDRQAAASNAQSRSAENESSSTSRFKAGYNICRQQVQDFLSSRAQHYTVLGLVSFDLLGIFADIIINLYQCDEKDTDPKWDDVRNGLGVAGLVFSCMVRRLHIYYYYYSFRQVPSAWKLSRGYREIK